MAEITLKSIDFEKFAEGCFDMFKGVAASEDDVPMPTFIAQYVDKGELVFAIMMVDHDTFHSKDGVANAMRIKFKEMKVSAYVFLSEAWSIKVSPEEYRDSGYLEPSKSDKRIEVITMAGMNNKGVHVFWHTEIIRDANNKKTYRAITKHTITDHSKIDQDRFGSLLEVE